MKQIIESAEAPKAVGPYSQAVVVDLKNHDTLIFTSGQLPIDYKTNKMPESVQEQTKMSLDNVTSILKEKGMTLDNVIKATVYLSDIKDFKDMNEIYASYFGNPFPARSAFEVANLPLGAKVEIEVIAGK